MIEKLTQKQIDKQEVYKKKWIDLALYSGDEIDMEKARKGIEWFYEMSKLEKPDVILVDSPLGIQYLFKALEVILKKKQNSVENSVTNSVTNSVRDSVMNSVWDSVTNSVENSVRNSVWDSVRNSVENSVWDSVENSVTNSVRDSVENSVWDSVTNSVENSVRNSVWDSVTNSVRDSVMNSVWNSVMNSVMNSVRNSVENSVTNSVWDSVWDSVRDSVENSVTNSVENSVRDSVENSVTNSVWNSVENSVWDSVRNSVWDSVTNSVWDSVENSVRNSVENSVRNSVRNSVWKMVEFSFYNLTNVGWVAFYDYFTELEIYKKEAKEIWDRYIDYLESGVFFTSFYKNLAVVSRRPKAVRKNNEGRFHSDKLPSIEWRDGYKLYFLNGVEFPENLWIKVVSGKMPFEKIMKIEDIDQRTQAMKYGSFEDFSKSQKAILADSFQKWDINGNEIKYELWSFPKGNIFIKDVMFVHYWCPSTNHEYTSGVPDCKTVKEAFAWKFSDNNLGLVVSPEDWSRMIPLENES